MDTALLIRVRLTNAIEHDQLLTLSRASSSSSSSSSVPTALINSTTTALTALTARLRAGSITRPQFTQRAVTLARVNAHTAAQHGAHALASSFADAQDLAELDNDPDALNLPDDVIEKMITDGWIDDYADAAAGDEDESGSVPSPDQLAQRAAVAAGVIYGAYNAGQHYAARRLKLNSVDWKTSPTTKETCEDCSAYERDSPYAIDDLPTYPGVGDTSCNGACRCTLRYHR